MDQFEVVLPSAGSLTIQMTSDSFDSDLALVDSQLDLPPIASGGGDLDAMLKVDLLAGTYVIIATSATTTAVRGSYSLSTTFVPAIWYPTSTIVAPDARSEHTAVWTGSEMIIWGGNAGNAQALNSGARLDPTTNRWTPISTANAPSSRWAHTAVWTGTEMIVWGGVDGAPTFKTQNDGARYNPTTDTWTPISRTNAPSARLNHTAVWTGTEMIVWGGFSCEACGAAELDTGARYNPATDSWTALSTTASPAARGNHTAVWTGSRMIVWGGEDFAGVLGTGGVYDAATDSWTATSVAPPPTRCQSAVWTGTEMIIFGGQINQDLACGIKTVGTGSRYDPATDGWAPIHAAPVSSSGSGVAVVWTGDRMITWFDQQGARYDPVSDTWTGIAETGAPSSRRNHTLVWTGTSMVVWGGESAGALDSGGVYTPSVDPTP